MRRVNEMKMLQTNSTHHNLNLARRSLRALLLLAMLPMLALVALGCSDTDGEDAGGFVVIEDVKIDITPDPISFQSLTLNEEARMQVTIFNKSDKATAFVNLELREDPNNDTNREFGWGAESRDIVDDTISIAAGESVSVFVTYTPKDEFSDTGTLIATFNGSSDDKRREVTINTLDLQPDIDAPTTLSFSQVGIGEITSKTFEVQNVGRAPLTIRSMELNADVGAYNFCTVDTDNEDCTPDTFDYPIELEYLDTLRVKAVYHPQVQGEDVSEIDISSNDPDEEIYTIELNNRTNEPCIRVTDEDGVDLGNASIGRVSSRTMTILNCSDTRPLEVTSIVIGEDSDPQFSVDSLPGELGEEDGVALIVPGATSDFVLNYAPDAEAANQGEIVVRSDAANKDPLIIPVNGRGSNNACPTSVARARVQNSNLPWGTSVEAIPLDTIELDGSESLDPDNPADGIARYEWAIMEQPEDSTTRFTPNNNAENPTLFLDLAGRYVLELRVFDADGSESCEPAEITILATPDEDIHIQLVWDTDRTDVDLHFLHPSGTWGRTPYDCYFGNRTANWGVTGTANDDPSLDIDDTNGFGPENINLNNPEDLSYSVAAHYYSDHGNGPSNTTVRIWLQAVLVFEYREKFMTNGQFWDVATINWGARPEVQQIDSMRNSFPGNLSP